MTPALKPFQHVGSLFLAERTRALLADEPGVGKTAQFITAANLVGARRVGVVCPDIGTEHWRREFNKWNFKGDRADVISWDEAHEIAAGFKKHGRSAPLPWDVLIPDESHFGKNPQARRTKSVFGTGGLGWYARRIWAGSGTPAPNNAAELWPMLRAFGKTKMDLATFTNYFCVVDGLGKVRGNRADHIDELRVILKSISLRRTKADVLPELGEIDVQEWYVKPSPRFTFDVIPDMQESRLRRLTQGRSDDEILALLADPSEDFATLRRYNALLKAPAIFDTVQFEHANGLLDKVVIYGYHKEALEALQRNFEWAKIDSTLIYGDTPKHERDAMIERWKKKGTVILASIVVASTALDFTAAHQGIMIELDWVNGNNSQAMQRMHRHGQTKPVTIRVALGSHIDEVVNSVLLRKAKDFAALFGGVLPKESGADRRAAA